MKKGLGIAITCIALLAAGCTGKTPDGGVGGVRVLMRYDFGSQEYASVDSAQREMERWVQFYNTGAPEDGYSGTVALERVVETEDGYQGYLDWGEIGHFEGVRLIEGFGTADDVGLDQGVPLEIRDIDTGERAVLDAAFVSGLPSTYKMICGPVSSFMIGADQIVVVLDGPVRYATAGWSQGETGAVADPAQLYRQGDGYFAIVYEPGGRQRAGGTGRHSWVGILAVGVLGITGILLLSRYQRPGGRNTRTGGGMTGIGI